ncbi:MAG: DMT family transporter [Bacteroidales bacterium]|nr:DMT family transporter [Bacteroidales bacterium]
MKKSFGHISAFFAYTIFGFNIIICRDLSTLALISPMGLLCFRVAGAAALFWLTSLFLPKEKVDLKDFPKIFLASMLGLFLTQWSFLKASTMTTPFDTSILTPLTPIFTMFIAAIVLKEPITLKKAGGVALSFIGVIFLILNTVRVESGGVTETQPMGIVYMIGNCIFFAMYLGAFRPLITKYSVVTFMKWMFLFSAIVAIPFDIKELVGLNMAAMPTRYLLELGFVILFSTFVAYFLIPVGQKVLRPTVISLYGYVQPLIATVMGIATGMDRFTWQKVLAAVLVFTGVILVNKSRAASH